MASSELWIHHRIRVTPEIAEERCGKCGAAIGTNSDECFEYNHSSEPSPHDPVAEAKLVKDPSDKREYRHMACLYPNPSRRPAR